MKIENPIFNRINSQNVAVPEHLLYHLHENEERKGLAVEAKLLDKPKQHGQYKGEKEKTWN